MGLESIFNVLDRDRNGIRPFTALVVLFALVGVVAGVTGVSALGFMDGVSGPVQAGVSVTSNETAGTVTVTWTSNQNAEYLDVALVSTETGTAVETRRLDAVGESTTLTRDGTTETVRVVVTAVQGTSSTVIHDGVR